ncbi:MAG: hypothetical protein ABI679_07715 [Gemmatimonadota bacterium]
MSRFPLRYLPWMLRDLLLSQGLVLLTIGVLGALILSRITPAPLPSDAAPMVLGAVRQMSWPFILFCVASIVSADRLQGYYRTTFVRPVNPSAYYLSRFLLGGLMVGLLAPVMTAAMAIAVGPIPLSWSMIARLEMLYLLLGGAVFLASTLTRADWLFAILVFIVQSVLHGLSQNHVVLPAFWNFIAMILPPFHLTSLDQPMPPGPQLAHVLLYGLGFVLAALAVLRWRPLGSGGRS